MIDKTIIAHFNIPIDFILTSGEQRSGERWEACCQLYIYLGLTGHHNTPLNRAILIVCAMPNGPCNCRNLLCPY